MDYEGFPKSVWPSINEVVCHGIPSEDEILKDGDIVEQGTHEELMKNCEVYQEIALSQLSKAELA